jgi:hypothetical protein
LHRSASNRIIFMSKREERQRFIRHYKDVKGEQEIDMHKVAAYAKSVGWKMPTPPSDVDMLAKLLAEDAQAERRHDKQTGKPYRAYQAIPVPSGQLNLFVYVDTDEATRPQMKKSTMHRREQIVTDAYSLTLDLDHWHSIHPSEEQIELPLDLTFDVELRKAAEDDDSDKAA